MPAGSDAPQRPQPCSLDIYAHESRLWCGYATLNAAWRWGGFFMGPVALGFKSDSDAHGTIGTACI